LENCKQRTGSKDSIGCHLHRHSSSKYCYKFGTTTTWKLWRLPLQLNSWVTLELLCKPILGQFTLEKLQLQCLSLPWFLGWLDNNKGNTFIVSQPKEWRQLRPLLRLLKNSRWHLI
jgi:hypothetical protein